MPKIARRHPHARVVGAILAGNGPICWECDRPLAPADIGNFKIWEHHAAGPVTLIVAVHAKCATEINGDLRVDL